MKSLATAATSTERKLTVCAALLIALLVPSLASASDAKFSTTQRQEIIRNFLAEHPFVHRTLPRGKSGIRIEDDKLTPSEAELNQMVAQFGTAAKPGDRAKITAIKFVHEGILFEINGGPVKRKKWTDRVSIGVGGVNTTSSDPNQQQQPQQGGEASDIYTASTGSSVLLVCKHDTESLTTDRIKDMLAPVLDFKAMSVAEAYQKTLPPVLATAVKNHHPLVGMDKEMVTYALGRPPHRVRETKDGKDIEEWIYGAPPQEVDFIRFYNDKVISIEEMKVTGEKVVRDKDEVGDLGILDASAKQQKRPEQSATTDDQRRSAPTLMRPDEKSETQSTDGPRDPNPVPPPDGPASNAPTNPN